MVLVQGGRQRRGRTVPCRSARAFVVSTTAGVGSAAAAPVLTQRGQVVNALASQCSQRRVEGLAAAERLLPAIRNRLLLRPLKHTERRALCRGRGSVSLWLVKVESVSGRLAPAECLEIESLWHRAGIMDGMVVMLCSAMPRRVVATDARCLDQLMAHENDASRSMYSRGGGRRGNGRRIGRWTSEW